MARQDIAFLAFNRGLVSRLGLARADIKRIALSAETYNNYMARVLGSMSIRPGRAYLGSTASDAAARFLPFIFSTSDKALVELTNLAMRVWVSDALITRAAVTTAVTNGSFPANLGSWTDNDEAGGISQWVAPGYMELLGTGTAAAIRTQQVTVAGANISVEHALRISIVRGPVTLRVGSTSGADDYISETPLDAGTHSLALTPTGNFYIQFQSRLDRVVWVDSCEIEAAGVMSVTTPWTTAGLGLVRFAPSGDILFCAANGFRQYKIERRSTRSWSVVEYIPEDGPFRVPNIGPGTLTAGALAGNTTLTSSIPLFKSTHVGALFSVTSTGQTVTKSAAALNDATNSILVEGTGTDRAFTIVISGMTAGRTVILQRAFDDATWAAVSGKSWTADTTESYTDALDNQSVYYRLLVSVVGAAGTTTLTLSIATGSITGICRVTNFTSNVLVSVEVFKPFGSLVASDIWSEGKWSDYRGYPSSVAIYEGRMVWAGKDTVALSVSDGYYSFDDTVVGDSGPVVRTIGSGPVDVINWILPLQRLILGGQGAEHSCKSTSFDEPLTPTNFNIKKASRQGSAAVEAVEVDSNGVYVQRGGVRVFSMEFSGDVLDYVSTHLTALVPKIGAPGIVRMAVQRQPDTRLHCIRSDGTVAIMIYDKVENVTCWLTLSVDAAGGQVEDVVVLPGDDGDEEDHVYYVVKYTINGTTKRYLEKWAFEDDCLGDADLCYLADSCVTYTGAATTTVTAAHLAGEQVVIWADGADVGTDDNGDPIYTLDGSGQCTLPTAVSNYVVGLPYTAQWKSGKLVQLQSQVGLAMKDHKTIAELGLIMADVHRYGVKFGSDFTNMNDLPSMEGGLAVGDDEVRVAYDEPPFPFPGSFTIDQRLCLQSQAPRPATILAAFTNVEHHG
tara:strand:- start:14424 stop:17129 length:2706 start_codon:yes stop_codon:yes gene_type:complete